jgi:phage terminase large subunit
VIESTWENPITGVISGQKTGKTDIAACAGIAWVCTHPEGVVRIAASSEDVIKDGLWAIVRRLLSNATEPLGPEPALDPSTGWRLDLTRRMLAVTAKNVNTMAGRSGAQQLWIVDEACGLIHELWEVILGNLLGGGHLLWLTNPTVIGGKVYDWDTNPNSSANIIHIDSRETPNFPRSKGYTGVTIPGLATPEGVGMIFRDYGEESPEADVRVYGRFARAGTNAVIPLALAEMGIARWEETPADGPLVIGVDVARFGDDDSCIAPRRGQKVLIPEQVHGFDTVAVAGKTVEVARSHRRNGERAVAVVEINGVGGGVFDILRAQIADTSNNLEWLSVVAFDSGAKAEEDDKYVNRRSELWFTGRKFLAEGGAIPNVQRLKGELTAPVYGFDVKARQKVESKDDVKKKTQRSPDVADAVLISLTHPGDTCTVGHDEDDYGGTWGDSGFGSLSSL